MKTDLNYCIVLSSEQLSYLAGSKYGIDRMKILHQLIEVAVLKETEYAMKGFSTTLQVGQAILSEVDLSCKLGYDKKTISRVLDKMNRLGIVASTQGNRTSVHTLKCVSAWMQDSRRIDNPFYVRLKDRSGESEEMSVKSDDKVCAVPVVSGSNSDSSVGEHFPNSKGCGQLEAMAEASLSDDVFLPSDEMPVVSDEGELLSPSSLIPPVTASPQPLAEEESGDGVSAECQA